MNTGIQKLLQGQIEPTDIKGFVTADLFSTMFSYDIDKEEFSLEDFRNGKPETFPESFLELIKKRKRIVRDIQLWKAASLEYCQIEANSDFYLEMERFKEGKVYYTKVLADCQAMMDKLKTWKLRKPKANPHPTHYLISIKAGMAVDLAKQIESAKINLAQYANVPANTKPIHGEIKRGNRLEYLHDRLRHYDFKISLHNDERKIILKTIDSIPD